jgi:uncharacterized protein YkwD
MRTELRYGARPDLTYIYQQMTENFGDLPVVNGSDKETILVYDIQDTFESGGNYVGGCFDPVDLTDDEESNHRSMIFVDTYPSMTPDPASPSEKDVSLGYSTIAHELQHAINYNENVIVEGGSEMSLWLNEGLSMAAEDMLYGTRNDRIAYFKGSAAVQNGLSVMDWQNDEGEDVVSSYAMSYMFAMYLEAQAGTAAVFKDLIDETGDTLSALDNVIYQDIDQSITFSDLLTNFRIALMISADSGPYGFGGDPDFYNVQPLTYTGNSVNLAGAGAIVTEITASPFTDDSSDQGADILLVGVYTPSAEEIAQQNKEAVIALINAEREAAGIAPMVEDSSLDQAAAVRAEELSVIFSHDRPNRESLGDLVHDVGISNFTDVGENALASPGITPSYFTNTIAQTYKMDEAYTKIGLGTYASDGSDYWAVVYLEE